ncbi:MAG: ArdC-like ssDNA-binding domain-containing protein [Bacteroidota bacterium]
MQNTQPTHNPKPKDVYEIVTNRIIEHLEKGVIPWQKPWTEAGHPKNLITGKNYKGINVWLLSTLNYAQNYFLTFKQVKELGGQVKKGEKSQEVIFWKWLEREDEEDGNKKNIPLLKYYNVFNIDQCDGIPIEKIPPKIERQNDPIETCEKIINEMQKRPEIRNKEQQAYYHKIDDYINIPKTESFLSSESYYGALFHELVHSTGHKERLDRKELTQSKGFRTNDYAVEELTAEMGASYLKSLSGIPIEQLENNAAYIQGWLERLKKDKKFIVYASAQAQKATDYILNIRNQEKEPELVEQNENESEKSIARERGLKEVREKEKVESIGMER